MGPGGGGVPTEIANYIPGIFSLIQTFIWLARQDWSDFELENVKSSDIFCRVYDWFMVTQLIDAERFTIIANNMMNEGLMLAT